MRIDSFKKNNIIISADDFNKSEEKWKRLHYKNCDFELDIENPKTLSDKMTFCDIYYNFNTALFRKDTAKKEVTKILKTDKYCVPTYQVCESVDDIDFYSLVGKSFVIKPNNKASSHGVFIQKKPLKTTEIQLYKDMLKDNRYIRSTKRIVVEMYIGAKNSKQEYMTDYKFWCFNGKPFCVLVIDQRSVKEHKKQSNFYDTEFHKIALRKKNDLEISRKISKPKNFKTMVDIASKIAKNMPCVRVDLYNVNGKIYFGECQKIYSFHCIFKDMSYNISLADKLDISKIQRQVNVEKYKNK